MALLEERIPQKVDNKSYLWRRYIDCIFFFWELGEEKLRSFVENISKIHPTIKFIAEWLQKLIFLDVTVSLIDVQTETYLNAMSTDSHLYLHSFLCYPYQCKKSIPYSQALCHNQIPYKNNFFDIQFNNLKKWLNERGYCEKLVRKEVLKARNQ